MKAIAAKSHGLALRYKHAFQLGDDWRPFAAGSPLTGWRFEHIVVIDWPDKLGRDQEWLEHLTTQHITPEGTLVVL